MNKTILLVFAFILTASLVFAAVPSGVSNGSERFGARMTLNESERNDIKENGFTNVSKMVEERARMIRGRMNFTSNYGGCVSDAAKIRNECYNESRGILSECRNATTNSTELRVCQSNSKDDMKVCKDAFKTVKRVDCGKIKANFLEKMRYFFA